jgi:hypothetical protein
VHFNHTLLYYVCELTIEKLTDTVDGETCEELVKEIHSMILLADLSGLEMMHCTKHLVQGWWQMTTINELKKLFRKFFRLKGIITDYKSKLLPRMKNEPMSLFFSKLCISILGNMVMWAGWKSIPGERVEVVCLSGSLTLCRRIQVLRGQMICYQVLQPSLTSLNNHALSNGLV